MHVLGICDHLGTCWHNLGIMLKLPREILDNINVDRDLCAEKAREMLYEWMRREGRSATVECLVKALEAIGNKLTAEKLLENEKMMTKLRIARVQSAKWRKDFRQVTARLEQNEELIKCLYELLKVREEDGKDVKETRVQELKTNIKRLEEELSKEESDKELCVKEAAEEAVDKESDETRPGNQTCSQCSLRTKNEDRHNQEKQNLTAEKQQLEMELKESNEEIKKLKNDIEQETNKRKEGNKKCNEHITTLMQEKRDREKKNEELEKEKENLKKKNKELEKEKENLNKKNKELEQEKENLKKVICNFKLTVEEETRRYDILLEKERKSNSEVVQLQKEVDETQFHGKTLEKYIITNFVSSFFFPSTEDFQKTGVVHAIKCQRKSAEIVATRSSDGPGKANDVLDHSKYKQKGASGSCGTDTEEDSWWRVDLGENYLLFLTHYSLRHGKKDGDSLLRRWMLQGSIDGENWKDLESKERDNQLKFRGIHPYFTGTWPTKEEVGAFRYFRILQTGRNSSGKYGIFLYGIELYGVLLKRPPVVL